MNRIKHASLRGLTIDQLGQVGGGFGSIATGGTIVTAHGIVAGGSAVTYGFGGWPYYGYGYAGRPYGYGLGYRRAYGFGWY